MVHVDVRVTTSPDEFAHLQVALLRHHVREQRVAGDVERHAEEHVCAALVQLARQLAVGDVELEQRVTGCQRHLRVVGGVPGRDDDAPRIRILLQQLDHFTDLVDGAAVLGRPAAPLVAVDRTEVAVLIGPLVPDLDTALLKPANVCVSHEEPQQLKRQRLEVNLLARDEGKFPRQIIPDLSAEHAERAGARSIFLGCAVLAHILQKIFVW